MDIVVIGTGLFGLTIAERAASSGLRVLMIEKREQIGGNAFSYFDDETGIEVHKYGSHLFHTSNRMVWDYVNRFSEFNNYVHRVKTVHNGEVYSMPINLGTINQFFRSAFSPIEARNLIGEQTKLSEHNSNLSLESKAISLIGKPLYDAFIKGYTQKQWQTPADELPAEIITRLPIRFDYNDKYFDDKWQGLPLDGYQAWFEKMIGHKNIEIELGCDFLDESSKYSKTKLVGALPIVYTGALDSYFNYSAGHLNWRTLDFETEKIETNDFQGTSVMNFANENIPFTRVHEFKHLHQERTDTYNSNSTIIMREYSRFANIHDDPYYPVNSLSDKQALDSYRLLLEGEDNVYFGGRLGTYKYLDMHMAIASAHVLWNKLKEII